MRLSIKVMHYFLTAVDRRSIVQAAQDRNVVPSAISNAIDAVEEEFGLKLVQRYPAKGIQPTSAGMLIAQKIRRLIEAPPYLLLPPTHPLARRRSVSFRELAGLDMILLDLPFTTRYLRGLFDDAGFEPQIVATASSSEMIRNLVGAGVGCSILNMRPLASATQSGKPVVEVAIRPPMQSLRLVLGSLNGKPRRVVSAVRESILAYFDTPEARRLIVPYRGRQGT
ncbi:LysR family transcriptional regulator [Granulosicoccus sp. 3-233]|uniref:LysR family transcriptional regulator n=1 Tax=Granulosicoccus sp. 3-233 TaxID=3417969 RepID=UPI003D33C42D